MIERDLERAAATRHDLIVIGGGVHGVALALTAAEAGLKPLLVEAEDFGGGASWNSLRILHGGLRYLQSCDLPRFRELAAERRWFMRRFPHLVGRLPCLMPLYGDGLRRATVMRAALFANDLLSTGRNDGVAAEIRLPGGQLLDRIEALERFPLARAECLQGAALWYDAFMTSSERILVEMLRQACALGAQAANYARVERLHVDAGRVSGVSVHDGLSGTAFDAASPVVIACLGGAISRFLADQGAAMPGLFPPSLAFNVLLDLKPPAECAVAVSRPGPGAPLYFLLPRGGHTLAGTAHFDRPEHTEAAAPSEEEVAKFIAEIGAAVPRMGIGMKNVVRVFAGLLSADSVGTGRLARRARIVDHAECGGPSGLFSVSGIKFTTARSAAERALKFAFPRLAGTIVAHCEPIECGAKDRLCLDHEAFMDAAPATASMLLRRLVLEEFAHGIDDVLMRRTNWGASAANLEPLCARVSSLMDDSALARRAAGA